MVVVKIAVFRTLTGLQFIGDFIHTHTHIFKREILNIFELRNARVKTFHFLSL